MATPSAEAQALAEQVLAGDRRALARVLTLVENDTRVGRAALRALYPRGGNAHTVGMTGAPGSGKSTLAAALARELRRRGRSVAIVAVDPSSPFTRGAILGDRVRMQDLSGDAGVFVRSMASRGAVGGLAPTTGALVAVLDAAGYDLVIVETVGAGQDEVDVAASVLTTVVVVPPAAGDDVQALKAGIIEVADLLVVNKADLPQAGAMALHLESLADYVGPGERAAPVLRTIASRGDGVSALLDAVGEHRAYLGSSGRLRPRLEAQARRALFAGLRQAAEERARSATAGRVDALVADLVARRTDPRSAVDALLADLKP